MAIKKLTALLLLCLTVVTAAAQQAATVKSFTLTNNHIPGDQRKQDLNGDYCALVKIQVVDDIERIEGNIIGDIVKKGIEKQVYMCKGSRNMRIHFANHLPVRVMFRDYDINGLESNRVYELIIEMPDMTAPPTPVQTAPTLNETNSNYLRMRVSPANAKVVIKGERDDAAEQELRPQGDGSVSVQLPFGRYHYRVSAPGYEEETGEIFLTDESTWKNVELTGVPGNIAVTCPTPDADIYVDNRKIDRARFGTGWSANVKPGNYVVEARRKGYVTQRKSVSVRSGETSNVSFDQLVTETDIRREQQRQQEERAAQQRQEQRQQAAQQRRDKAERYYRRGAQLGVIVGANMANASFSSDYETPEAVSGFHVGLTLDIRLASCLYLTPGVIYSQKGYKYEGVWPNYINEEATPQFVDVPLLLSVRTKGRLQLQFGVGPYVAMALSGDVEDEDGRYSTPFSDAYSSIDYGVQAGVQLRMWRHLSLGASYQLGMGSSYQNRTLGVSLGIHF